MALTPSGTISLGDINTTLGRSATAAISMDDAQVRFIANQDTGEVAMSSMQNKYNFNGTITVAVSYGGTYVLYGYSSAVPQGSITGGPLWNSRALNFLYTIVDSSTDTFIGSNAGGTAFPNISMRMKVGSNGVISMTYDPSGNFYQNNGSAAITGSDVGSTLNWQFSQT
jgi:hypothetical protein